MAIRLSNVPPASSQPGRMSPYMLIASFWRESSSLCGNIIYLIFAVYLLCPSSSLLLSIKASAAVVLHFQQRCLHPSSEAITGNFARKNGKDRPLPKTCQILGWKRSWWANLHVRGKNPGTASPLNFAKGWGKLQLDPLKCRAPFQAKKLARRLEAHPGTYPLRFTSSASSGHARWRSRHA